MRKILTLTAFTALFVAPAAHAQTSSWPAPGPRTANYLTGSVTMDQGETLTFYNFDALAHDVTARDKGSDGKALFVTPLISAGESAEVEDAKFLTTGAYGFFCSIHPNMVGTLNVTSAGTPAPRPGPGNPAPADTTSPTVTVKVKSAGIAKVRRARTLAVEVSVDEAASIALTAKKGKATIATGAVKLTGAGKRQRDAEADRRRAQGAQAARPARPSR